MLASLGKVDSISIDWSLRFPEEKLLGPVFSWMSFGKAVLRGRTGVWVD